MGRRRSAALAAAAVVGGPGCSSTGSASPRPVPQVRLPAPAVPAPRVPPGADLRISGLTPVLHFRRVVLSVDTALVLPEIDPETWTLRIDGMVGQPIELSFADLLTSSRCSSTT